MFIFVFLALYALLKENNHGLMIIVLIFVFVGSAIFFATNNPFTMLTLSDQYANATTEMEKSALLGAGETILANTNQRAVGGFNIGLFLVSIAGLITSLVMRRNHFFSKSTATNGILAFGFSLADYLRQAITQSLIIALPVILLGALLILIWFTQVGIKLYQLGGSEGEN
jgi:hypothetical protein